MDDDFLVGALDEAQANNYLGNYRAVYGLLGSYASEVLTSDHGGSVETLGKAAEEGAKELAEVLLGKDTNYPGPPGFPPARWTFMLPTGRALTPKSPRSGWRAP
jgi:hypothetical protein